MENLKEKLQFIRESNLDMINETENIMLEGVFSKIADKFRGYSKEKYIKLKDEYSKMPIKQLIELYAKSLPGGGLKLATNNDNNVKIASELTVDAIKSKKERFQLFIVNGAPFIYNEDRNKVYCWAYIRGQGIGARSISDTLENVIDTTAKIRSEV